MLTGPGSVCHRFSPSWQSKHGWAARLALVWTLAWALFLALPAQAGKLPDYAEWRAWHVRQYSRLGENLPQYERAALQERNEALAAGDQHATRMASAALIEARMLQAFPIPIAVAGEVDELIEQARRDDDATALLVLVLLKVELGAWRGQDGTEIMRSAQDDLQAQLAMATDDDAKAQLHLSISTYYRRVGRLADVAEHVAQAVRLAKGPFLRMDVLSAAARMNIRMRDIASLERALAQLNEAAALFGPERYPVHSSTIDMQRASLLRTLKRLDESLAMYDHALAMARRGGFQVIVPPIRLGRAEVLGDLHRTDEVLAELTDILAQPALPNSRRIHQLRARMLAERGDPDAVDSGKMAIVTASWENAEAQSEALAASALALGSVGRYREAYEDLARSAELGAKGRSEANEALAVQYQAQIQLVGKEREAESHRILEQAERKRRIEVTWIAASLALALGIIGWLYLRQRTQQRKLVQLRQTVQDHNDELQAINAYRSRQLAAACHDLREPAHSMGMLAELARSSIDPAERLQRLDAIQNSSETLTEMLSLLMDMAHIEGIKTRPTLAVVSVDDLFEEARLQFAFRARQHGLELVVPNSDLHVSSDRHLLRRMLLNLVSNALKFTEAGRIELAAEQQGDEVILTVRDTGPGIPEAQLADIFSEKPARAASASIDGLGLGLPTCKRAAELLGHAVRLESIVGQGTLAEIRLPAAWAAQPVSTGPIAVTGLGLQRRVIFLENDLETASATTNLLERWGFEVSWAPTVEALNLAAEGTEFALPDLLISDLHLQNADGLDGLQRLRRRPGWGEIPALLVTGDLADEVAARASGAGVEVVYKPLSPKRLSGVLRKLLEPVTPVRP